MGRYYYRPTGAVHYGDVQNEGGGVTLGDNNDNTRIRYYEESGSILVYPPFNAAVIPAGRKILSVRAGHRQVNGFGLLALFNGWCVSYLRIANARQSKTKTYEQDGFFTYAREKLSVPYYKQEFAEWTAAEISTMSTDVGSATGTIGPNSKNFWCAATESFIVVTYDEPVPVPNTPFPANGQTIATSSVSFSAVLPAVQMEQPVQAVFQVARDAAFTQDVRNFIGGLNQSETAGTRSYYNSRVLDASYTDLGPGLWYLRMKGRDMRGAGFESAWGLTTNFTITHTALPVPALSAPQSNAISPTPYAVRSALFTSQPSGERKVGATWQFSKDPSFETGVVGWTNRTGGFFIASAEAPATVSYDPAPSEKVGPGLDGPVVSLEDPSQYLAQGIWFARVRATDVYGQSGAWSGNYTFTVAHPPVVANLKPSANASFDQNLGYVTWDFTDPWNGDMQSAYQMKVYDNASNLLQDTGKVTNSFSRAKVDIPATFHRQIIGVVVSVWDRDNVKSTSEAQAFFRLSKSPVVTIVTPQPGDQLISGQPLVQWSAVFAASGVVQKSYELKWVRTDTGVTEFTTGVVLGTATSYTPPKAILRNLTAYQLTVSITDSENLTGVKLVNFSTNFERPDALLAYADSSEYAENGYVTVYYPSGTPDPYFFEWRIYRRRLGTTEWVQAGTVQDPMQKEFRDWLVAGSGEYQYTVTQAATRFGSIVESEFDETADTVLIFSDSYWFIIEDDETQNVQLHRVTGDNYTDRVESNEFVIIGGGRRRNIGERIGKEGTLNVSIRNAANMSASEQIRVLQRLNRDSRPAIMRDPYGNLTLVSLGEISLDRDPAVGMGVNEFADLTVPYFEVM